VYRRNLPHIQKSDAAHFVTYRTKDDFVLPPEARDLVLKHCLHDHNTRICLHAAVVMPNHVHLIFTPLRDDLGESFTLAEIMSGIKGASAHSVNKLLGRNGSLWQDESFDRVLRSPGDLDNKLLYLMANPLRSGLAKLPDEYRWLWREQAQPRAAVPHDSKTIRRVHK
jgi:REP element-mobilizing transposase RayT